MAFSDRLSEFQQRGAEVIAVSTDSVYSHKAWAEVPRTKGGIQGVQIPIAADLTKMISRDYGVLDEAKGIALRGTFIINPEGTVVSETVNFFPVGRNVDECLRTIDAFQEAAKGVVCPVGWTKGKEAINPKEASKYFEKLKT
jgi:alkyl hydroperoxide reductase subunit AhpC